MSTDKIDATFEKTLLTLDEIVFEERNKAYGAYDMRQSYRSTLTKSFIIGTVAFILLIVTPFLLYFSLNGEKQEKEQIVDVVLDDLDDYNIPPQVIEDEEPPPPPPVVDNKQENVKMVKDMMPEPKRNPPKEMTNKSLAEVKDAIIGTEDRDGEKVKTYVPPPPPPNTGVGRNVEATASTNEIVEVVDQSADFINGGLNGFRNLFQENFDTYAVEDEGIISAIVTFVVEKDGTLTQIKATGKNPDFNREAIRTVKSIKGRWRPGKLNGHEVRQRFRFPVKMAFEY